MTATMNEEILLNLPYEDGEAYAIGEVDDEILLAVGTLESDEGSLVLVVIAESPAHPVPLESFFRFMVPIEFYDEPKRWHGRV